MPDGSRTGDIVAEYEAWRRKAEAQLLGNIQSGAVKMWTPVAIQGQPVIPLFGGTPTVDWDAALSMILKVTSDAGEPIRIVDLTSSVAGPLDRRLRKFPGSYLAAELGMGGSLDPLLGVTDPADVAALLADIARAEDDRKGRNVAASVQNLIGMVLRHLDPARRLDLERVHAAVGCGLHAQSSPGVLTPAEEAAIINGPHAQLKASPQLLAQMFEVESILSLIAQLSPGRAPRRQRGDPARGRISLLSLSPSASMATRELAADALAARVAMELRSGDPTTTVLLGADDVPPRLLDAMATAAEASGAQLMVFFERLSDGTKSRLGWRGGSVSGFFRLANHEDAEEAADFLGRRHSFVLAGMSETRTRAFEWGWSMAQSTGTSKSNSRAFTIGSLFSSTLSKTRSSSQTTTTGASGGRSASFAGTQSYERVYEHLVEPGVFQGLGPGALLLVDAARGASRLASCSRDITRSSLVDWGSYVEIAET